MKTSLYLYTKYQDRNRDRSGAGAPGTAERIEALAVPEAQGAQDTIG